MNESAKASVKLTPVPTQRASEAIYEQLSAMIISGELKPGERLPSERAMMDMLGRSRPTIREALRMLERNGLIQIVAGSRGAIVRQPSPQTVEEPLEAMLNMRMISNAELLEYRELNEVATAGWAAERRTEEDLHRIRHTLEQFDPNATDFKDFSHKDIAFHQAIAEASHNRVVTMVDRVVHQLVVNVLDEANSKKAKKARGQMLRQIYDSHSEILNAIAAGDAEAAREAMRRHMRMFEQDMDVR